MYGERIRQIYAKANMGNRVGYGHRPAIVVVDLQVGFSDPEKSPMASKLDSQIEAVNRLVDAARVKHIPIIFTVIAYEDEKLRDAGLWLAKSRNAELLKRGGGLDTLDARLHFLSEDLVIVKKFASAFFGTCLFSTLTFLGADTLIVTGCTTSGCVRATVVDGLQYGFRVIVPIEAVGDRDSEPHEASLFDIDIKYGDVVPINDVLSYLESLG